MTRFDFSKINIKDYEDIDMINSIWYKDIIKSLEITEKFIINNKLILVGGLAIHYSLILKGQQGIYGKDKLPDWDCVSPQHQKYAYELAMKLCKMGISHTNAIQGLHLSTMRTRIFLGIETMDISYNPKNAYDIICKHSLTYKNNLKIIHPHFQLLDIHRALSLPYENEPLYSIGHRWAKDMKRFDLLYNAYPIPKESKVELTTITFPRHITNDSCISGIVGLAYWIDKAHKLKLDLDAPSLDFKIDKNTITCLFPDIENVDIVLFSDDYTKLKINEVKYFQSLLHKMPERVEYVIGDKMAKGNKITKATVYNNLGQKLSCHTDTENNIYVANLQVIMLYLLERFIYSEIFGINNKDKKIFATMYVWCIQMVKIAAKTFEKNKTDSFKIFLPTGTTYGVLNETISMAHRKNIAKFKLGKGESVRHLTPPSGYPELKKNNCIIEAKFDPTTSNLFAMSGKIIK